jgi:hypothetical protein
MEFIAAHFQHFENRQLSKASSEDYFASTHGVVILDSDANSFQGKPIINSMEGCHLV